MPNLSVSAAKEFKHCQRSWYYKYIERIRYASPASEFGRVAHYCAEQYAQNIDPTFSEALHRDSDREQFQIFAEKNKMTPQELWELCKRRAKMQYDTARSAVAIGRLEQRFEHSLAQMQLVGAADVVGTCLEMGIPIVLDYKFTGNLRNAKTDEELSQDLQARTYATFLFLLDTQLDKVKCRWQWAPSKPKQKDQVIIAECVFTRQILQPTLDYYYELEKQMLALEGVVPDPAWAFDIVADACSAYGGCKFYEQCHQQGRSLVPLGKKPKETKNTQTDVMADLDAAVAKLTGGQVQKSPLIRVQEARAQKSPAVETKDTRSIGTLYINCKPMQGDVPSVYQVCMDSFKQFKQGTPLSEPYGAWKEPLLSAVTKQLTTVPQKALFISRTAYYYDTLIDTLIELAGQVVAQTDV